MEQQEVEKKHERSRTPRMALGIQDTADALGVHPNTVRNLIHRKELASVKVGRLRMVRMSDLEKLLRPESEREAA